MCRMVGFAADHELEIAPYLDAMVHQAQHGCRAPHAHGYGIAVLRNGHWLHVREQCAPWETDLSGLRQLRGTIAIIHARKASDTDTINLGKLHPFFAQTSGSGIMFCQNGTICRHERLTTSTAADAIDTEKYFALILDQLLAGKTQEQAIVVAVEQIQRANAEPTSLNALLSDGRTLVAYKGGVIPENIEYNTLLRQTTTACGWSRPNRLRRLRIGVPWTGCGAAERETTSRSCGKPAGAERRPSPRVCLPHRK